MTVNEFMPRYKMIMQKEQEPIYPKTLEPMRNVCTLLHRCEGERCSRYREGECTEILDSCPYKAKPWKKKYDGGQKTCCNCRKSDELFLHSKDGICDHSFSYREHWGREPNRIDYDCWEPNGRVRNPHCGKPKETDCLLELPDTPCKECKYFDENLKCPSCGGPGDVRAWVDGTAIVHCHKCDNEWRYDPDDKDKLEWEKFIKHVEAQSDPPRAKPNGKWTRNDPTRMKPTGEKCPPMEYDHPCEMCGWWNEKASEVNWSPFYVSGGKEENKNEIPRQRSMDEIAEDGM